MQAESNFDQRRTACSYCLTPEYTSNTGKRQSCSCTQFIRHQVMMTYSSIIFNPALSDCEDGEFSGMNGRGNRSTRRKLAPVPLCPPQMPLDQTRARTRSAKVGSQRLTLWRDLGTVVCWGTRLQAGRSPVRGPDEVDFFNLPNPSSRTMALGSTHPLTEMSTRTLPRGKKRPALKADKLAAIYEPNVWKCGILNLSQP
jgi:hypothetical protein